MTTSKSVRFALMLALAACGAPDVGSSPPPPPTVSAVFDPLTGNIPLPNDLALAQIPPTLPPAQQDLLKAFAAQGGFPNDQEVPVTISFQTTTVAADGTTTNAAPDLDLTSLNPGTLVVFLKTPQGVGTAPLDPVQPADYVKLPDRGTLTLHHKGRTPWPSGQYVLALRGGAGGVKSTTGSPVVAAPTFFLIAQGEKLDTEQNLALLRAQTGSTAAAKAAAAQLQGIIAQYSCGAGDTACLAAGGKSPPAPDSAFAAVDQVFPHQQAAVMTTFRIAPIAGTQVQLDPGRGLVPLPIDLLRDPRPASASCAACGKLTPLAACTLAQGTLDAQGVCRDAKGNVNAAAAGFAALDGFSTTGFILAPTSDLVVASTVNSSTVKLFDLSDPAHPALVPPTTYITEPAEITQSGLSPTIGLQPAGATAGASPCTPSTIASVFCTRPLKDNTDYAVVITDGVQDKTGKPLVPGTVAKILQFTNPTATIVNGQPVSLLAGIDNATAFAVETMRQKLAPVLNGGAVDKAHVAMAYTFHTQTILSTAAQLGALPYGTPAQTGVTQALVVSTPTAAFQKYGVDPATVPAPAHVNEILETKIVTFNLLDPLTGAFNPDPTKAAAEPIDVMIATPLATSVAANCALPAPLNGLKCSPVVVFRHGLGRGRLDMLLIADSLTAKGFTVVAIDAEKHGDRSFCTSGQATIQGVPQCTTGVCETQLPAGAQGDAAPPGKCPAGSDFVRQPVSPACRTTGACPGFTGTAGIPVVSSNYLVSTNFFRTRDTLRQDIIDQSQLVRAVTAISSATLPNPLFDHTSAQGFIADPQNIFFAGQSLGAIQGTVDVAANPRISRAVLNVGGGTIVDIFTNSPAFVANTDALLASLGIQPGANSAFLQFLVVAKTILDPADPVNFAEHLQAKTLPNLLVNPPAPQATKAVLAQAAFCDQTVPNPFNFILDSTAGTTPLPPTGAPGTFELYFNTTTGGAPDGTKLAACPPPPTSGAGTPGAVSHGFLTDWVDVAATTAGQTNAANFLGGTASPASIIPVP